MSFPIGADVVVVTFGNQRGVVIATARDGRYRVQVAGVTMWCREAQLAPLPRSPKTRTRRERPPNRVEGRSEGFAPAGRLDLHGLRIEDAMALVTGAIDRALVAGADRLDIVHGKGSGRLRHALHHHLAAIAVVKAFRLDPHNPGVTCVEF
jgi:DNA mismatch repair protein MutS2